ncbi:MAG: hypothetical protein A3D65_03565 [Candidatus Lloydbacteria bacterium RIFCSPHIGHO2_02_FULL_50_13]|uniref:Uncharacterized protein n=1 Tax=Candidatus Lloydbacteria bacterium RIFCSPHIGHO2_02_FULL_50_13 TaxID=1798661 RepID=A0A1G2D495_9BACT|nr:MAG: hypothetical protein A3D65_03565 [Candidatus Lloydbacteria bacterium RIFCSPHIGHO2_02_FULL_50_13]
MIEEFPVVGGKYSMTTFSRCVCVPIPQIFSRTAGEFGELFLRKLPIKTRSELPHHRPLRNELVSKESDAVNFA